MPVLGRERTLRSPPRRVPVRRARTWREGVWSGLATRKGGRLPLPPSWQAGARALGLGADPGAQPPLGRSHPFQGRHRRHQRHRQGRPTARRDRARPPDHRPRPAHEAARPRPDLRRRAGVYPPVGTVPRPRRTIMANGGQPLGIARRPCNRPVIGRGRNLDRR
jgi:hypothetical protein